MSFLRCILCDLRIAYVPKVGHPYRWNSDGPFDIGPILRPLEKKEGYLRYKIEHKDGSPTFHSCRLSTFAAMAKEVK